MAHINKTTKNSVMEMLTSIPDWKTLYSTDIIRIRESHENEILGERYKKAYETWSFTSEKSYNTSGRVQMYYKKKASEAFHVVYSYHKALNFYVKAKAAEHNKIATKLHSERMAARRK